MGYKPIEFYIIFFCTDLTMFAMFGPINERSIRTFDEYFTIRTITLVITKPQVVIARETPKVFHWYARTLHNVRECSSGCRRITIRKFLQDPTKSLQRSRMFKWSSAHIRPKVLCDPANGVFEYSPKFTHVANLKW